MYYYLLLAAAEIILIAAGGYPDATIAHIAFAFCPLLGPSTSRPPAASRHLIMRSIQRRKSCARQQLGKEVADSSSRCAACCHRSALFPRGGGLGLMNSLAHGPGVETPPRLKYHSDMQTSAARGFGVARQIGLNYGAACWCVCMNMRPLLLSLAPRSLHS
jgi:hypothetical protein